MCEINSTRKPTRDFQHAKVQLQPERSNCKQSSAITSNCDTRHTILFASVFNSFPHPPPRDWDLNLAPRGIKSNPTNWALGHAKSKIVYEKTHAQTHLDICAYNIIHFFCDRTSKDAIFRDTCPGAQKVDSRLEASTRGEFSNIVCNGLGLSCEIRSRTLGSICSRRVGRSMEGVHYRDL